jgi:hypothetical protein
VTPYLDTTPPGGYFEFMPVGSGVFAILPPLFFSPLARANREHYAALLVLYFRLFQESSGKLERELVIRSFTDYLGRHREALVSESSDDDALDAESGTGPAGEDRETPYFDFDGGSPYLEVRNSKTENTAAGEPVDDASLPDDRAAANRFLRRIIAAGWLGEETLPDYTRVINIAPHARPFFEALIRVDEGLKTEYESHVVAIYSLLCGDAVEENGHYAVLNAHGATTALIDSLKVLSQSIKGHYDRFTAEAAEVKGILHLHYDIYAAEILDGAYKRLKTSDNLSRYRPRIQEKVGKLLEDERWLAESARKYSRISALTQEESRSRLVILLEEIRDTLKAVDPLLDDIDRRNMLYARASIERIKALLEPDSTLAGKLGSLVREIYAGRDADGGLWHKLAHRLYGVRTVAPESLYRRYKRDTVNPQKSFRPVLDAEARKKAEDELFRRLRQQLSPGKISAWLDELGGSERLLASKELIEDEHSFERFIYSVLYADSRPRSFSYKIEEDGRKQLETETYAVPDLVLRRKP